MATQDNLHVLIVGAGLGGLTLAQALRKQGISFEIFERFDASRAQGYAIGIHSLFDDFAASFPDDMPPIRAADNFLPLDLPAQIIYYQGDTIAPRMGVQDSGEKSVLRCNRQHLRDWLATGVNVQYNKTLTTVEAGSGLGSNADSVTATFSDGTSATGSLLVGADGVYSSVRQHILTSLGREDPLQTLPLVSISGAVLLAGADMERQLELGYSGYTAGYPDRGNLFAGLDRVAADGRSGHFYWSMNFINETTQDPKNHWVAKASAEERLAFAKDKVSYVHPRLRNIVEKTKADDILERGLTLHDLELDNLPVSRVTLLGDAAHCMTPFRGEGGVHAMRDGLSLARSITAAAKDGGGVEALQNHIGSYQTEMLDRGVKHVRLSRVAADRPSETKQPRYGWGKMATEIPEVSISLDTIPWVDPSKLSTVA